MIYIKAYTKFNLGDDLLIRTLCTKYPNEQFCILADSKYKKVFQGIKNLEVLSNEYQELQQNKKDHSKWLELHHKFLENISKKCDTFLYIGGSIFLDRNEDDFKRMIDLKREIEMFHNSYIIGANFGPSIHNEYQRYMHEELIPSLNHISFRDWYSYQLFQDLKNVFYAPDIIFSLEDVMNTNMKKKEVGISLIYCLDREDLKIYYEDYINELCNLAIRYIKKGYQVRLLSFCDFEKDSVAISDFLEKVSLEYKSKIVVDYYHGNIKEFLHIFSQLDTIVATRFHAIILGFLASCKVIPICYSDKSIHLLEDLDITEYVTLKNIKQLSNLKPLQIDSKKINKIRQDAENHFSFLKK